MNDVLMNDAFKKFDLTGKTAFVTGGGTGIGYYMARGLARSGARVMIASRRAEVLKVAASKIASESNDNEVLYCTIDLTDRISIKTAAEYAISTLGGVDIFIGNAAQDVYGRIDDVDDDMVDRIFQVNVSANIALSRMFVPHMRKQKWGRVIFSSSIASVSASAQQGVSVYGSSKSAINQLARSIAADAGHDGITANCLVLGAYMTEMLQGVVDSMEDDQRQQFVSSLASMNALGRFARPEEIEGVIQLLASDAGSYITGADIPVEGGWIIMMRPNMPENLGTSD